MLLSNCDWPFGSFSASPSRGNAPLTVHFTPNSTVRVTDWYWDFGDGSASASERPSHTYTQAGAYDVSLTIVYTAANGQEATHTETQTSYITVSGVAVERWLYITNFLKSELLRIREDGSDAEILANLGNALELPTGLAIDPGTSSVFVIGALGGVIRTNADGEGAVTLTDTIKHLGLGVLNDIDVDPTNGFVYLAGSQGVARAATTSPGVWSVLNGFAIGLPGVDGVTSLAVDAKSGRIYWISYSTPHVWRSNLDGTGTIDLGNLQGVLCQPWGIAVDAAHQRLYVINDVDNGLRWSIVSASLDGTDARDLGNLGQGTAYPLALTIDSSSDSIYALYYEGSSAYLVSTDLEGRLTGSFGDLGGLLSESGGGTDIALWSND
ncbi:MAG: PKD domain-containing protein [Candidatus Bipolaricaulis sp.]|nr:PKD domain-containing protein [Candidatus Bipolaricaulis sp.]